MKILVIAMTLLLLGGCQKNSFESCVEYHEAEAKRKYPEKWQYWSNLWVSSYCKVSG